MSSLAVAEGTILGECVNLPVRGLLFHASYTGAAAVYVCGRSSRSV